MIRAIPRRRSPIFGSNLAALAPPAPSTIDPGYWLAFYGPPPAPAVIPPTVPGAFDGGTFDGMLFDGPVPGPPAVLAALGAGCDLIEAILDAFANAPDLADFEGRISEGLALSETPLPYAELHVLREEPAWNTVASFDRVDIQFSIFADFDEGSGRARDLIRAVKSAFDWCDLTFTDGYLMGFERTNAAMMPAPMSTKGADRIYQGIVGYRVMVGRYA